MESFKSKGLNENLLRAIGELGFETPTPIQERTIPAILNSESDIIALAQTGTGKTAGFGLPIIQQVDLSSKNIQALILCPTRELCLQITRDLDNYSKYVPGFTSLAVYGGARIDGQMRALRQGVHVVVGTPGRTLDLIKRRSLKIDNIRWLVLDEADEMLNMGFKEDLDEILATTPKEKQSLLFSATMPDGVRNIAKKYMNEASEITVGKKNSGADNVSHHYYVVKASDRYAALKRIADINPDVYGIVFCRTRMETKDTADKLIQDGYNADALHGDLSQPQRDYVMNRFRNKSLQLLVATDVAARGLDVNDLSHVINYNLPDDPEVYIHRSGRTGRAGKSGICVTITHSREQGKLKQLERIAGKKFTYSQVPGGREICEKRLFNLIDVMEKVDVSDSQIDAFLPAITAKLDYLSKEEIIKKFVSVEFNTFLEYYKKAPDLNISVGQDSRDRRRDSGREDRGRGERSERSERGRDDRGRGERSERGRAERGTEGRERVREDRADSRRSSATEYSRFFINVGKKQELGTAEFIGLINDVTGRRDIPIGKIELERKFSFFEIDKSFEKLILKSFENVYMEDLKLQVEVSTAVEDKLPTGTRYKEKTDRGARSSERSSGRSDRSSKPGNRGAWKKTQGRKSPVEWGGRKDKKKK